MSTVSKKTSFLDTVIPISAVLNFPKMSDEHTAFQDLPLVRWLKTLKGSLIRFGIILVILRLFVAYYYGGTSKLSDSAWFIYYALHFINFDYNLMPSSPLQTFRLKVVIYTTAAKLLADYAEPCKNFIVTKFFKSNDAEELLKLPKNALLDAL